VTVVAQASQTSIIIEVTDDGPGIPPDRWQSVFERFGSSERPDDGDSRLGGGTGLGLAIARWAVVLHGGQIAVVPAEGGGCRIRVEIPAVKDLHKISTS
jgi:signal transduction histidine kinase